MTEEKKNKAEEMKNRGNWSRLKRCMKQAEEGNDLVIGFFGGSITQGSLASKEEYCYAYRTFQWWKKKFPKADIRYVNGGIGGTNSLYGVSRVVTDLLMYRPDVVVVDFSVNDDANAYFQETYEGVIRSIDSWETKPAVIVLNNVFYDTGENAQEYHNEVAVHYGIPCVNIKDSIYAKMQMGIYKREQLTPDGLHPNDEGHRLLAGEIIRLLELVYEDKDREEKEPEYPAPITENGYEGAIRLQIGNSSPVLEGFRADTRRKEGFFDHFKNGWIGRKIGDRITFWIEGRNLAVQYRKTIHKPAPVARVVVDGDEANAIVLDGNFQETWGDCLYLQKVLHHSKKQRHKVVIEIIEASCKDAVPFYLLSLIAS